ncbi:DMT family transporter [Roseateles paludis]|uniref:DMT family transporter n=1 Tax=Roseateles paludis TaxID=3145238 RepID=A0ABV0FVX1_9BURK
MPQTEGLARLPTALLFAVPVLIWASTWHVILYQIGSPVPALASLAWRFALAAALLAVLAWRAGQTLRAPRTAHAWLLATGLVHYAGDYWSIYEAERYIPTGLVAVLFCLAVFFNALGVWLLKGQRPTRRFLLASSGAVLGVALVFWPEIAATGARPHAALGLGLGLVGVITSTVGSFFTLHLMAQGLPLLSVLAWSMGYGALWLLGLALCLHPGAPLVDLRPSYLAALLYLSVFGSVVSFAFYFRLAERTGPAKAALTGVAVPVIALGISALFEGWQATPLALLGIGLALVSLFVATRPA